MLGGPGVPRSNISAIFLAAWKLNEFWVSQAVLVVFGDLYSPPHVPSQNSCVFDSDPPFLSFSCLFYAISFGSLHNAFHVSLHALFIESIELQSIGRRRSCRAGTRYLFDGIESVDKDSVCNAVSGLSRASRMSLAIVRGLTHGVRHGGARRSDNSVETTIEVLQRWHCVQI